MLLDPERKIRDVERMLGYSDPAHYTRAFHRWAGLTPRHFRRQRLEEAVGGSAPRARREPVRER